MPERAADSIDWDFKERDLKILRELSRDPQVTTRELASTLGEKYGIDISHVTVSESIRGMREAGVFREAILPNEDYFNFALFEFRFETSDFGDQWEDAMHYIMDDPHTLLYFISNGEYQWKTIMMFRSREAESKWIHDCYKEHGGVIDNVRNSVVHNLLKFRTDPEIFDFLDGEIEA